MPARHLFCYSFKLPLDLDIVCAVSKRASGNMSLCYGDTRDSLINRKVFLNELGINYQDLVCAKQVHKSDVRYVEEIDKGKGALSYESSIADTDAFITDKTNLPLAVFTADCLPVFLYDAENSAIGLVHSGWRGACENIASKTVQLMIEKFNTQPKHLYAAFGPCIRSCCYEVGEEFKDFFSYGLIERDNRYYFGLAEVNKKELLSLGVKDTNIFDSNICTSCRNEEFFSYRKEGKNCGRTISVVMLK